MSTSYSGGNKCSYINCNNNSKNNKELSFFPYPAKDKERCDKWIVNSGREDFKKLSEKQLQGRRLCSIHFERSAFTNARRNRLLLKHPKAIPVLWFQNSSQNTLDNKKSEPTASSMPSNNVNTVHIKDFNAVFCEENQEQLQASLPYICECVISVHD